MGYENDERRKVNVLEMNCLRSLVGVSRMDRVRNEEVRRRAGILLLLLSSQARLPPSSQAGNKTSGCGNRVRNLDKQVTLLSRRKKHYFVIKIQI